MTTSGQREGTVRLTPSRSRTAMSSVKALTEAAVWTTTNGMSPARIEASLARSVIVPEPTRHDAADAGDVGVELGARGLVGMQVLARGAQDGRARREPIGQGGNDTGLEVVAATLHRRVVHHDQDVARPADLGDVVGHAVEDVGADPDAADPDRTPVTAADALAQLVERGRIRETDAARHAVVPEKPGSTASNSSRYRP